LRSLESPAALPRLAATAALTLLLGACGALPERPVLEERLDRTTGTTVHVIGNPCRFITETRSQLLDQIEFLDFVPFQTNRAGRFDHYVAVIAWRKLGADGPYPAERAGWQVMQAGGTVTLSERVAAPRDAGLAQWPVDPAATADEVRVFRATLPLIRGWIPSKGLMAHATDAPADAPRFEALTNCDANLQALLAVAD
jgi:hypothetical protein